MSCAADDVSASKKVLGMFSLGCDCGCEYMAGSGMGTDMNCAFCEALACLLFFFMALDGAEYCCEGCLRSRRKTAGGQVDRPKVAARNRGID